jgi:hypothetical protein
MTDIKLDSNTSAPTREATIKRDGTPVESKKENKEAEELLDIPAYVVEFKTEKTDTKSTYTPQEVKSKASALLQMGTLPEDQQKVLAEILSSEKKTDT